MYATAQQIADQSPVLSIAILGELAGDFTPEAHGPLSSHARELIQAAASGKLRTDAYVDHNRKLQVAGYSMVSATDFLEFVNATGIARDTRAHQWALKMSRYSPPAALPQQFGLAPAALAAESARIVKEAESYIFDRAAAGETVSNLDAIAFVTKATDPPKAADPPKTSVTATKFSTAASGIEDGGSIFTAAERRVAARAAAGESFANLEGASFAFNHIR